MDNDLPNWTEVAQVIIGFFGFGIAILTVRKLLKKDIERASEIHSLSAIASQLKDLQLLNERRYIDSKKPQLEISILRDGNLYFVCFRNLNSNGQITSYSKDYSAGMAEKNVSHRGKEQTFVFSLISIPKKREILKILMTYVVDNTYEFQQQIELYLFNDQVAVSGLKIELKN